MGEAHMNDIASGSWTLARDAEGLAWLTIDKAGTSANVLSSGVLAELDGLLAALERDRPRGVVVISAKKSGFIAGADIREFTGITDAASGYELIHRGQEVLNRLSRLPCPSVAAIHGFALGGGLELALACRYRVGVADDRLSLGLPEVQLGIHPGFGGTVRSVRTLGVRPAMEMMLTGKPVRAEKARRLGLVDRLVPEAELRSAARELLLAAPALPPRRAPLVERLLGSAPLRPLVRRSLTGQVARRARPEHYPAPYAIIELWARYGAHGDAALEAEARSIAQLFTTESSRNLVRVFLLQDRLKSAGGRFGKRLRDPAQISAARGRLAADVAGDAVARADVVIEAIFESLEAKQELYARIEPRMKPGALLATNTSSLMLEPLAAKLARPERLVGLHFFNPVPQMPLVEIVHAERTDPAAVQAATGFARRIDKLPLPCRSAPGFMVNRVLTPYMHEAMLAAQEGVPLPVIDAAAAAFGMPMGPIELIDVVGLDVAAHVGEIIARGLGRKAIEVRRLRELLAAKKLGRKRGGGFYVWRDGKAVKPAGAAAAAPPDLIDRLILILVNECAACLRERIVEDADLVDAAVVFGTGFAPFRGGPLRYARSRGVAAVVARLKELSARYGERYQPDPGWTAIERAVTDWTRPAG